MEGDLVWHGVECERRRRGVEYEGRRRGAGLWARFCVSQAPALGDWEAVKPSTGDFQSQITTISCKFYNHHQKLDCGLPAEAKNGNTPKSIIRKI